MGRAETITIVHFNDVYEVAGQTAEPRGGAARFRRQVAEFDALHPLVLFSGDVFNPSLLSTISRGRHMVPVLNKIGVRASVYGNHDFDFGIDNLEKLAAQCNFPWLMSNANFKPTNKPLGSGKRSLILEHEGYKIGLMGLIEREWLETLSTVREEDVEYMDFVEVAKELLKELREQGADVVIALTHMRLPNDEILCNAVPELDLVLGGHDHFYECKQIEGGPLLCKSGTDFRNLSKITVQFSPSGQRPTSKWERYDVNSSIDEDPEVRDIVDDYMSKLKSKMDVEIGRTKVELDCRFTSIRTRETNIGNMVVDVMRSSMNADIGILNSGTLRADTVFPPGPILMRDLVRMLPMLDETVVLGLTGAQIIEALENGVSQWPKLEGRFPQVSGVRFAFDGSKPPGSRVTQSSVFIHGKAINLEKEYSVVTKAYLAQGKDGYDVFTRSRLIRDAESCIVLPAILANHFKMLRVCSKFASCHHSATEHAIQKFKKQYLCHHLDFGIEPAVEGRIEEVQSGLMPKALVMTFVHFGDACDVLERREEPVGGAARFRAAVKSTSDEDPIVFFSGGAFNPSPWSTVTLGKHMAPILNAVGVRAAVYGSHDFDFGTETLGQLRMDCKFPWLMSNVMLKSSGQPLGDGRRFTVIRHSGRRIGVMGLVEQEWLMRLSTVESEDLIYTDYVEAARTIVEELRSSGVDMIIALTHMHRANDERLCREVKDIDLVLGGHDRSITLKQFDGPLLCKSGCEFRQLTKLVVTFGHTPEERVQVKAEQIEVNSSFDPNPAVEAMVGSLSAKIKSKLEVEIGHTDVDLDCRSASVRSKETAIGNMIADLLRKASRTDVALINSGMIRADMIFPSGPIYMKDLLKMLPMLDETVVLGLTGSQIMDALENGVSQWPRLDGRFPQVSGIQFSFDGSRPIRSRVVKESVTIGGEPIDLDREYSVVTKAYLAEGKDGYSVFTQGKVLVSPEDCPVLVTIVRNYLKIMMACKKLEGESKRGHTPLRRAVARFRELVPANERSNYSVAPTEEGRIVAVKAATSASVRRLLHQESMSFAELYIVHFNDVYDITPGTTEPVGGAARFCNLLHSWKEQSPIVLFSGDAFNPSLLSTVTKGRHMVPVLNKAGVNCALYGNHDFDFGIENLEKLAAQCNFPWLISNAYVKGTTKPLANGLRHYVLNHDGRKLGIMGLIEREWLDTLASVRADEVEYVDFIEVAKKMAAEFKAMKVDIIVALTHMRLPNDELLCREVPELDLVLGGHDHSYYCKQFDGGPLLCKSGTDFRELTKITTRFHTHGFRPTFTWERFDINSSIDEDPEVRRIVDDYMVELKSKMDIEIGTTRIELDCRFTSIRTRETNIGNFVVDLMRKAMGADIGLINSGTLRADTVFPPGPLLMRDLVRMLPMLDETVVLGLTGAQIIEALENGVSQWPKLEGRFPQVSGIRFAFDGSKPPGSRVIRNTVMVLNKAINVEKEYSVVTKAYLAQGKDGYDIFCHGKLLRDSRTCVELPTIVASHFKMLRKCKKYAGAPSSHPSTDAAIQAFRAETRCHEIDYCIEPKLDGRIQHMESTAIPKAHAITFVHFGDACEVLERRDDPVGGAARFRNVIKQMADEDPVLLFSGGAFNPSPWSTVTLGKHMAQILTTLGVRAAVYGNHDFDFGLETLGSLRFRCKFPWLMSNVINKTTKQPLGDGRRFTVIRHNGRLIGVMGLVEQEWLMRLSTVEREDLIYTDYVEAARTIVEELRLSGVDMIIALTHMHRANDERLCREVKDIDLVLGGHDRSITLKQFDGPLLCKSGCEFRQLTKLVVTFGHTPEERVQVKAEQIEVNSSIDPDPAMEAIVNSWVTHIKSKLEVEIGTAEVELDCRIASVRTKETRVGNMIADLLRKASRTDVALINSGMIRGDTVFPPGPIYMKDLLKMLPMLDETVVLGLTGAQIMDALENGVSHWPKLDGRFPQISGFQFTFDGSKPVGSRIVKESVRIGTEPINLEKEYSVVTKAYLAEGKDGYSVFTQGKVLVSPEDCPVLVTIIRNHLKMMTVCRKLDAKGVRGHTALRRAVAKFREELAETGRTLYTVAPCREGRINTVEDGCGCG